MKKNIIIYFLAASALYALTSCVKTKDYYGAGEASEEVSTISFSTGNQKDVLIKYKNGVPGFVADIAEIPVSLKIPVDQDVKIKLTRDDSLVEKYYSGNSYGVLPFPESAFSPQNLVIKGGQEKGVLKIKLQEGSKLTNDEGYIAAFKMEIEEGGNVKPFGVQNLFIRGLQYKSSNKANLSVNGKVLNAVANDVYEMRALYPSKLSFKLNLGHALDKDVTLKLIPDPELTKYLYPDMDDDSHLFPENTIEPMDILVPMGQTEVDVELDIKNTHLLHDIPGYLSVFKLKEKASDREIVSAAEEAFFTLKVKKENFVTAEKYTPNSYGKITPITVTVNGDSSPVASLVDSDKKGEFVTIPTGSGEIVIKYSGTQRRACVLYSNLNEKGISSFRVALSKDGGKTWIAAGKIETKGIEHEELKIKSIPRYAYFDAIRLYDFQGTASGLKVFETEIYPVRWWE